MKSILLLCTALAGVAPIASQALAQTSESNAQIEEVIVTGRRPPLNDIPMKPTFTESTITPEAILNASPSPANTIQTLLNTQPSIYATTGATNGMETDIKFRSFSDGEFGETVAGVPLNDIFNSGVTYQADNRNNTLFIVRDLDSVQLYRGVNNPAVNTYNSLGGTINYIPRQPTDEMGGDIGVDGGSFNTVQYHATLNTGDWNGIRQTLSVERDTSSGWLQNTPDWNDNFYYAGNADLGANTQVFSYFVYNKNKGDAPQFIPFNLLNQNGQDYQFPTSLYRSPVNDTNYLGIVGFKSEITDFLSVEDEAYAGENDYKRTSFSNPAYAGPYFLDDQGSGFAFWTGYTGYDPNAVFGSAKAGTDYHFYGYDGSIYGDRIQATIDVPYNKIVAGGDFNVGELYSREYWYGAYNMPKIVGYNDAWDEHDTRQMWSLYAQDDINFWDDRIHITPGLKYISALTKDHDGLGFFYQYPGADKSGEHFLSPTLGASVEIVPDFVIYGAYGKNVKFPDITAFYNALGNSGTAPIVVKPEFAQDYEVGARYSWDSLRAEINLYEEDFTHVIFSTKTQTGFTQYQNGGNERFRGIELQLTDDFGEFYVGHWNGYLNASYNEAVCTSQFNPLNQGNADTGGGNCSAGQSLANVPNYLLNAGLIWDYDGWHVDLQGHYVGTQHLQDWSTGLPEAPNLLQPGQPTKIPDYFLVNVGIVKVVPIEVGPANALRFAIHVDNLFDKRYFSSAQTSTDTNNGFYTPPPQPVVPPIQLNDFYGLSGEGRAVFGSVSIYF